MVVILTVIGAYLAVGLAVAIPFVARWVQHVDPATARSGWAFRLLILPGSALLWPWILKRMMDLQREAQRAAMRARRKK